MASVSEVSTLRSKFFGSVGEETPRMVPSSSASAATSEHQTSAVRGADEEAEHGSSNPQRRPYESTSDATSINAH